LHGLWLNHCFFIPFTEVVKVLLDQGLGGQNEQGIRHHKGCITDGYLSKLLDALLQKEANAVISEKSFSTIRRFYHSDIYE
jgi:hypothetical protein